MGDSLAMVQTKANFISSFPIFIAAACFTLSAQTSFAQDPDDLPEDNWDGAPILSIAPRTIFPLYMGGGVQLHASPQLKLGLDFGTTPDLYADANGSMASFFSGKGDYKPIVAAAFENSSLYRVYLRYAFTEEPNGWGIELGFSQISSKNDQSVIDIAKATGLENDYVTVESTLAAAGLRPYIQMETKFLNLDVLATYDYEIKHNLRLTIGGGLSKIIGAEVDLSTKADQFDSSRTGMALLSLAETELSDGLEKFGMTPALSLEIAYQF